MKFTYFVGIDVSKKTLDITLVKSGECLLVRCIDNTKQAVKKLCIELERSYGILRHNCIFCMEHTGIYNLNVIQVLAEKQIPLWLESAVHIKRSLGLQRGKTDKIDSKRIGLFAYKNREEVKLWQPTREVIKDLKHFLSIRDRLLDVKKRLTVPMREIEGFETSGRIQAGNKAVSKTLDAIKSDLKNINKQIKELIRSDEQLNKLFNLVSSVDGIGEVVASSIIIATNEFISFNDPKKFACHCGVVPFSNESGTSIKGKNKVSPMANKTLKTLLHMAAMSATRTKGELKDYYDRKVAKGVNKMSVINAVRNKLVLRMFAVVRNGEPYKKYLNAA